MSVIDDYLKDLPTSQKNELLRVRKIILQVAPDVTETIGYGMPVFRHNDRYLIGMSAFKNHLSLFPGSGPIEALKDELKDYKQSKGTIQFTLEKPLSDELIKKIIKSCLVLNV